MAVNLRPLSLGEILDRTAQLYRENFILFAGIASIYAGVLLVLNLMQIGLTELLLMLHMARYQTFATLGFVILIFPVIIICSGAAMAANNRAVAWVNLGEAATIRGAYRSILPRLGRYLWIMAIAMFFAYLPFVVIYAAFFLLLFAIPGFNLGAAHHQGSNARSLCRSSCPDRRHWNPRSHPPGHRLRRLDGIALFAGHPSFRGRKPQGPSGHPPQH